MYWTPCDGVWSVRGTIRGDWIAYGTERSEREYPISDEEGIFCAPGDITETKVSQDQSGTVEWNQAQRHCQLNAGSAEISSPDGGIYHLQRVSSAGVGCEAPRKPGT